MRNLLKLVLRAGLVFLIYAPTLQILLAGWSSRLGPYFGLVAEYGVNEKFFIQTELNYASQGGKKSGLQGISSKKYTAFFPVGTPIPDYFFAVFDNEAILNYLELPILAKIEFPLNNKFGLFVNGGPYFGYLISAKNISSGSSNVYYDEELTQPVIPASVVFDAKTDVKDDINSFNFGIQGGVGLSFTLNNESKLFITAGGNYGLKSIQKDEVNGKNNTGAATVILGYIVKL